jgi:hypothetical protein
MAAHNDLSPYTRWIGQNKIVQAEKDGFNNPKGNEYDLARDGAFKGQKIAVLHLYTGEGFDFALPTAALQQKGFHLIRWADSLPDLETFRAGLAQASQLWIISTSDCLLTKPYIDEVIRFFHSGKGLYLWGDNDPFYADTNVLMNALFRCKMYGSVNGEGMVGIKSGNSVSGIVPQHPISTGIEHFFEGSTIATIEHCNELSPLFYGTEGQIVASVYDKDGKKAILDGGFTRLYYKWQSAGTARYVVNAAAWLVNYERFGKASIEEKKASIFDKMDQTGANTRHSNTTPDANDIFNKF